MSVDSSCFQGGQVVVFSVLAWVDVVGIDLNFGAKSSMKKVMIKNSHNELKGHIDARLD